MNFRLINKYILSGIIAAFLFNCSGSDDPETNPVTISQISPDSGPSGTLVTVIGTGFSATSSENIVKFNGAEAEVIQASELLLVAEVPEDAGTGTVTVTVGNNTVTGPEFTFIDEPQATATYFIKFQMDGEWKIFESSGPGFQNCGECVCCYLPPLDDTRNASIDVCQSNNVLANDILGWDSKQIDMESATFQVSSFGFEESGNYYHTDYASDLTDSWIKISDVVEDGNLMGAKAYKVTGTFQCTIAKSGGTDTSVTNGSFVVKYTEYY
jgi:hypothetical protein